MAGPSTPAIDLMDLGERRMMSLVSPSKDVWQLPSLWVIVLFEGDESARPFEGDCSESRSQHMTLGSRGREAGSARIDQALLKTCSESFSISTAIVRVHDGVSNRVER